MNLLKLKQPIVININQNIYRIDKPFIVRTIKPALEQDYKTAIILGTEPIPEGTELKVFSILDNYYGRFFEVKYSNINYYIDPNDCEYISMIDIKDCLSESDIKNIKRYLINNYIPLDIYGTNLNEYADRLWNKFLETPDYIKKEIISVAI